MPQRPLTEEEFTQFLSHLPAGLSEKDFDNALAAHERVVNEAGTLQQKMPGQHMGAYEPTFLEKAKKFAGGVGEDIENAVLHPIDNLPVWAGQIGGMLGGTKALPTGAATAALFGAGGAGIRDSINAFADPDELTRRGVDPTSPMSMLADMGLEGAKQGATELGGRTIGGLASGAKSFAKSAYRRALRAPEAALKNVPGFRPGLENEAQDKLVQIGLESKTPVSRGGYNKARDKARQLVSERDAVIAANPDKPIDVVASIAKPVKELALDTTNQVRPQPSLKAIGNTTRDFFDHPYLYRQQPAPGLTAAGAQAPRGRLMIRGEDAGKVKTGTWKRNPFGNAVDDAGSATEKAINRGLKDGLENAYPATAPLNAEAAEQIALRKALSRTVRQQSQQRQISLPEQLTTIPGIAGVMTGHEALGMVPAIIALMQRPNISSRLAIGAYHGGKAAEPVLPSIGRALSTTARVGQLQGNPEDDDDEEAVMKAFNAVRGRR